MWSKGVLLFFEAVIGSSVLIVKLFLNADPLYYRNQRKLTFFDIFEVFILLLLLERHVMRLDR